MCNVLCSDLVQPLVIPIANILFSIGFYPVSILFVREKGTEETAFSWAFSWTFRAWP
jgi:hypothetical protein